MTSITETVAPQRRAGLGLIRPSLLSFVAGVALASGVAVGINVMTDGHPAATPAATTTGTVTHLEASPDLRCLVVNGPC